MLLGQQEVDWVFVSWELKALLELQTSVQAETLEGLARAGEKTSTSTLEEIGDRLQ